MDAIHKTQDPKYVIIDNKLCNSATSKPIPDDEPIMIFRAQDMRAERMINQYSITCAHDGHFEAVRKQRLAFYKFAVNHPERMKEPDTHTG